MKIINKIEFNNDVTESGSKRIINLELEDYNANIKFPFTFESIIKHNTLRLKMKFTKLAQLPLNIAHAKKKNHKLQGISIKYS